MKIIHNHTKYLDLTCLFFFKLNSLIYILDSDREYFLLLTFYIRSHFDSFYDKNITALCIFKRLKTKQINLENKILYPNLNFIDTFKKIILIIVCHIQYEFQHLFKIHYYLER